ncbi:hypothetical protein LguiA_029259 [Lonicera macranthoides]
MEAVTEHSFGICGKFTVKWVNLESNITAWSQKTAPLLSGAGLWNNTCGISKAPLTVLCR